MVFVKVRETYDLCTVKNKMTVIAIHTPKSDIIKKNYPGLLMQCRAYRPVSCDVRLACASMLPLDPQGVGLAEGDVAPEDIFNPILYKAMSNKGMSQLEARINALGRTGSPVTVDVVGNIANVETDEMTAIADEFPVYYGLLSETHAWRHANPQSGVTMTNLKPYVYEMNYNWGDQASQNASGSPLMYSPGADGNATGLAPQAVLGKAKPMPFLNCTSYSLTTSGGAVTGGWEYPGFQEDASTPDMSANASMTVPFLNVVVGAIIVPPSRLHQLFYRMVCEWTIEFSSIRPLAEITDWRGLERLGQSTHYQNYSYEATKTAVTGDSETILDNDACMVSSNVDVNKVM